MNDAAPVLIGFDGSDSARRAVREAADVFPSRPALVVTVWEPAMEYHFPATAPAAVGASPPVVDVAATQEADDALQARAHRIAQDGAQLARSLGLEADALALPDMGNVARTIVALARDRGVGVIVIGSRGLSGLRGRLEGSTSNAVIKHSPCSVLVVHDD